MTFPWIHISIINVYKSEFHKSMYTIVLGNCEIFMFVNHAESHTVLILVGSLQVVRSFGGQSNFRCSRGQLKRRKPTEPIYQ